MSFMHTNWGKLYSSLTPAELNVEPHIAALGYPYRVQHPYFLAFGKRLPYFPDFLVLFPSGGVVIEVDDPSHRLKTADDARRTKQILEVAGHRVVRITNAAALSNPLEALRDALRPLNIPELEQWIRCS